MHQHNGDAGSLSMNSDGETLSNLNSLFEHLASRDDLPEDVRTRLTEVWESHQQTQHLLAEARSDIALLSDRVLEQERREKKLETQLLYNRKSGLPNHYVLDNDLTGIIREAVVAARPRTIAVMIVALDEAYEMAHKALDRQYTDWIIYECAGRIQGILPANARLYHTRDNEFVLLLIGVDPLINLSDYAERIRDTLGDTFKFPEYTVRIGCLIGSSVFPRDGANKTQVLRSADIALNTAKNAQKPYLEFRPNMQSQAIEKMELQDAIIRALEEQSIAEISRQFSLFFQPYFELNMGDANDLYSRLIGAEALIRWQHPSRGLVDPSRFIPVAEESGLIVPIGSWTLFRAAELLAQWGDAGLAELTVSVNLSPRQFKDPHLVQNVETALRRSMVASERFRLEITEGSVMDDLDEGLRKLHGISQLGVRIVIDDFGTGYSSLNYLRRLPIQGIKLDKSFIDEVLTSSHTQGIIRAVLHMAQDMGIEVVAEGVESYAQAHYLASIDCPVVQGYFFGKPVPSDSFKRFAEMNSGRTVAHSEEKR
ncbi:MAG: GGDEF domain-containing protein [Spirochaetaceae bacterium]|nr:MAG: GGDEF domain-containing protein [Spirochaetaceae bacterium]